MSRDPRNRSRSSGSAAASRARPTPTGTGGCSSTGGTPSPACPPDAGTPPGVDAPARGGFLDQIDRFDARFFGISAREAERMDPQQRLLLEVAWEAFEDAGIAPDGAAGGDTGVFVGISSHDYGDLQLNDPASVDVYAATGTAHSIAANRLSYHFDLRGPSLAIDTACSSSLVAVHAACRSLRAGECGMALAGGVNLLINPALSVAFARGGMLSPDGACRTFDDAAGRVRARRGRRAGLPEAAVAGPRRRRPDLRRDHRRRRRARGAAPTASPRRRVRRSAR
ncbi:beta-ketoacyl [acyl carrier protein] synthase domain-containing protein [Actinomadura madurae]|uniref:beta-ketoacyl [acyl carrier protein] synthase domain-containing protein n=1 Tax=Actinomadura madurae TaxID=1993 RepID=UPI0035568AF5